MKKRYLLSFSYLGTSFKASVKKTKEPDVSTVLGALECALQTLSKKLRLEDVSPITISSRTDRGVHALQNTAHVDITFRGQKGIKELMGGINLFCKKNSLSLRISSISQVSSDFNARRFAIQRSYLYRVGVPKLNDVSNTAKYVPISEVNRCHFLGNTNFNVDALHEVVSIFPGIHDFTYFCRSPSEQLATRTPIRRVDTFSISRGKPLMSSLYEPYIGNFDFWDFTVEGRSFVYNQVRRMVSAALAVAQGKYTVADVQGFLDLTSSNLPQFPIVPAHGLYLTKVTYEEKNLAVDRVKGSHFKEHKQLVHLLDQFKLSLRNPTK